MKIKHIEKSWLLFAAAAIIFLAIKIAAAGYAISDENTYYKMGELVASGQAPYRDFFFAHLPLQIYIYAAIFKLLGLNLLMLKMVSATAMVAAAAFVFATVKQKLNSNAALAATALFLFSYGTLLFSNFPTGVEIAVPFVTAALYFFLRKGFLAAGMMLGLGTTAYQLSAVSFLVLLAFAILGGDRKGAARFIAGFALVVGAVSAIFLLVAKGEFIKQTILYHLQKPSDAVDKSAIFLRIAKTNALLFIAALLGILSRNRTKKTLILSAAIAISYLAAFPAIKTAFNYYLLYAFPFLAIAGAYGIAALHSFLSERIKLTRQTAAIVIATILLTTTAVSVRQFASYDFQDFHAADEIAAYVKENSNENQWIFGDDSTVPLISLISGRDIAPGYADNNVMRYKSGITNLDETLRKLKEAAGEGRLKFVLLRGMKAEGRNAEFGIGTEKQFKDFVQGECKPAREFEQDWRGFVHTFGVYDCLKT